MMRRRAQRVWYWLGPKKQLMAQKEKLLSCECDLCYRQKKRVHKLRKLVCVNLDNNVGFMWGGSSHNINQTDKIKYIRCKCFLNVKFIICFTRFDENRELRAL